MSVPGLEFRLALPADAAVLGEFMARNFLFAYGHCSTPENVQAAVAEYYGEPAQSRQIADPTRVNLIAQVGDEWVGHAQLRAAERVPAEVAGKPALELARFYVDHGRHGTGVAQAMMREVKARARGDGGASLYLSVWKDAPQAIRFYSKEGFAISGELVFMVGDDPKQDWLMTCPLGPSAG